MNSGTLQLHACASGFPETQRARVPEHGIQEGRDAALRQRPIEPFAAHLLGWRYPAPILI